MMRLEEVRFAPASECHIAEGRDFARAIGMIGQSKRVDARMLAELDIHLRPAATEPLPPAPRSR